jgi:C4-dicarboxylate-specific signal transduction histidine kinase
MGELVASIAHEVNQPLSAIATNSQAALRWLARETPDYRDVVAALSRVNRDASLASDVIARIRNFLSMGGIKREPVEVGRSIDDLLLMLQALLLETGVRVDVRIAPVLPVLQADPVQLQQVLLNLVVNAVDAMRDQTWPAKVLAIDVSADPGEGTVFSVRDTGPGIASGAVGQIFDALFSTKCNGLGMGLAISRSIVENHGGRLRLAPVADVGANFVFNIPVGQ